MNTCSKNVTNFCVLMYIMLVVKYVPISFFGFLALKMTCFDVTVYCYHGYLLLVSVDWIYSHFFTMHFRIWPKS